MKDFPETIDTGLKANKTFDKFWYRFKKEGNTKRGIIDYSEMDWDKRTRVSKAKAELDSLKSKEVLENSLISEKSSLDKVAEFYYTNAVKNTKWNTELYDMYKLYVEPEIGNKKIKDIRKLHIDLLNKGMEESGKSKQTENGCSPRTIRKVIHQSLRPVLVYAVDNKVLNELPKLPVIKQNRKKKKVSDAGVKLATLYKTIIDLYEDEAFYRALFLFALYGRRWNEIRTLEWSDIDKLNNTYTIREENNKIREEQTYELPEPIKEALSQIHDSGHGLVFKSPVTGKELHPPKKQLAKIKEIANIPELTMHYFRHILVSAMGEVGTATTVLSASLGHTNLATVNDFYLSANHTQGSKVANEAIKGITNG